MTEILRFTSAEPIMHGVLKLAWNDGYEAVVDFRRFLAIGKAFLPLRDPAFFRTVRVAEYGHGIEWITPEGLQIDFGADATRELAERQAQLLQAS